MTLIVGSLKQCDVADAHALSVEVFASLSERGIRQWLRALPSLHSKIMIHNHPHDRLLKLIGFHLGPTSSLRDRVTLFSYLSHPTIGLKKLAGQGSVRCYVTKAGEVQEFSLPEIIPFFGLMCRLSREPMP